MIWHILEKDLRRLWLPIAASAILLACLATLDAWRFDVEASLAETVLNLLVPLAWSVLIALAVQLEPLTSDRAFWLTRPYRRTALFAAKLCFALVAVHLPLLVAQAAVLGAHGFWPLDAWLLRNQALVLFVVTLPSLAAASVTSSLAGFGWCALSGGAVAFILDAALTGNRYPWMRSEWMPVALAMLVLSLGAAAILMLQYARRTQWIARLIGVVAAASTVLTYSFVPREFTAALQCSTEGDLRTPVTVEYAPDADIEVPPFMTRREFVPASIPVRVNGLRGGEWVLTDQIFVRLSAASGPSWQSRRTHGPDLRAFLSVKPEKQNGAQVVLADRSFIEETTGTPVRVEGRASVRPLRFHDETVLPALFGQRDVPGVGRCSARLQISSAFGSELLKMTCEAPGGELPFATVALVDPVTGRQWRHSLGDSANHRFLPVVTWLSPLERRQTHLQITEREADHPSGRWLVPSSSIAGSQFRIQPAVTEGCTNVDYRFEVADLRKWIVPRHR